MSTEEKEYLTAEIADGVTVKVQKSNRALVRSIWGATLVVAGFLYHGFNKVSEAYRDVNSLKEFRAQVNNETVPAVRQHTIQLAVINNKLHIK